MSFPKPKVIVFGGSAGSIRLISFLFKNLSAGFSVPLIMALHRVNDPTSNLKGLFQEMIFLPIIEPFGAVAIEEGKIYLAPPGLHIVVEDNDMLNIESSPLSQYSRPSIDVLFLSAAEIYKEQLTGILVTGSNEDGALGIKSINDNGGITIVQDPKEAPLKRMPSAALKKSDVSYVFTTVQILEYLNHLC